MFFSAMRVSWLSAGEASPTISLRCVLKGGASPGKSAMYGGCKELLTWLESACACTLQGPMQASHSACASARCRHCIYRSIVGSQQRPIQSHDSHVRATRTVSHIPCTERYSACRCRSNPPRLFQNSVSKRCSPRPHRLPYMLSGRSNVT